ncbi:MAG: ATP-binding protein [bacterium]|nr:ATP-binding protein [bacterium]
MESSKQRFEFDAEQLELKLELTFKGCVDAIPPAVSRIMEVVKDGGCAGDKEFEIEVALNEALANAVRHGCGDNPQTNVQVLVACELAHGLLIVVRDPGSGFDPQGVPNPTVGENVFATSGRGIFLINQLMDDVRFERGGTEIWMRKGP